MLRKSKWTWRPCKRCGRFIKSSNRPNGKNLTYLRINSKYDRIHRKLICSKCRKPNPSKGIVKYRGNNKLILLCEPREHTIERIRLDLDKDIIDTKSLHNKYLNYRRWLHSRLYPKSKSIKQPKVLKVNIEKVIRTKEDKRLYAIEYRRKYKDKVLKYYNEYKKKNYEKEIARIKDYYRRKKEKSTNAKV